MLTSVLAGMETHEEEFIEVMCTTPESQEGYLKYRAKISLPGWRRKKVVHARHFIHAPVSLFF